jgi:hypothetical protein
MTGEQESCAYCGENVCLQDSLNCTFCDHFFHPRCCSVKPNDFIKIKPFLTVISWTCQQCRNDVRKLLSLQKESKQQDLALVAENGPPLNTKHIGSSASFVTPNLPDQAMLSGDKSLRSQVINSTNGITKADMVTTVIGTMREVNKRKQNIIITGLFERADVSDTRAVNELFEYHLNLDFRPCIKSTLRLGRVLGEKKQRKLLVRFASPEEASAVMSVAKDLRHSCDVGISRNVFINRDLTKDEARIEYEERLKKKKSAQYCWE